MSFSLSWVRTELDSETADEESNVRAGTLALPTSNPKRIASESTEKYVSIGTSLVEHYIKPREHRLSQIEISNVQVQYDREKASTKDLCF